MAKIPPLRLKKYDTTQKIMETLTDSESRVIVFSIIKSAKAASDIASKYNIPQSTVYKKLKELEDLGLIRVDEYNITDSGRKYKMYKSVIRQAVITISGIEPSLKITPN